MNLETPLHVDSKNGVVYKYHEQKLSFFDAEAACQSTHSSLAHIETTEAKTRIFNYLQTRNRSHWWIGLRNEDPCCWKWLNGPELNRSVIDFSEEHGVVACGSLFQPSKGFRKTFMYDYGCETKRMSFICESEAVSYGDSSPPRPGGLGTAAVVAVALGIVALAAIAVVIILLMSRRCRSSGGNENCPREESVKRRALPARYPSTKGDQYSDYATIDDDAGYATIDTVVYSEVIDESHQSGADNMDQPALSSAGEVTYAIVCKEKSPSISESPPKYAQVTRKKSKQ